ncbi:MAG: hypothetical protein R3F43_24360 [bacterium]
MRPGDVVEYAIRITQTGSAPGPAPLIVDAIPAGTVYVAGSTRIDGRPVPDRGGRAPTNEPGLGLRGRDGSLQPGETVEVRFQVQVPPATPAGTRVDNQALVEDGLGITARSDDPDTAEPLDPTSFIVGGGGSDPLLEDGPGARPARAARPGGRRDRVDAGRAERWGRAGAGRRGHRSAARPHRVCRGQPEPGWRRADRSGRSRRGRAGPGAPARAWTRCHRGAAASSASRHGWRRDPRCRTRPAWRPGMA